MKNKTKIDPKTAAFTRLARAIDHFLKVQGWTEVVLDQGAGVLQQDPGHYGLVVAFTGKMKQEEETTLWSPS